MNYRFKGTDYTQDQLNEVAVIKGYTLDELLSNNPDIETIEEETIEEEVDVEKNTPAETTPAAAGEESGDSEQEDFSLEQYSTDKLGTPTIEKDPVKTTKKVKGKISKTTDIGLSEKEGEFEVLEEIEITPSVGVNLEIIVPEGNRLVGLEKIKLPDEGFDEYADALFTTEQFKAINLPPGKEQFETGLETKQDKFYYLPVVEDEKGNKTRLNARALSESNFNNEIKLLTKKFNEEDDPQVRLAISEQIETLGGFVSMIPGEEAVTMPEVQISADERKIIDADPTYFFQVSNTLNTRIAKKKQELSDPNISDDQIKTIQQEISDLEDQQASAISKGALAINPLAIFNTQLDLNYESKGPSSNSIFGRHHWTKPIYELDENGEIQYDGEGKWRKPKIKGHEATSIRYISDEDPENIATNINNKFLNYGLGADVDGDDVLVYKNPVMASDGSVDLKETLKANGVEVSEGFVSDFDLKQLIKENNLVKSMTVGGYISLPTGDVGLTDKKQIDDFLKFIDDNKGDFRLSENISEYQGQFYKNKLIKQQNKTKKVLTSESNNLQNILDKNQKNIDNYNQTINNLKAQANVIKTEFDNVNNQIISLNNRQEELASSLLTQESFDSKMNEKRKETTDTKELKRYQELLFMQDKEARLEIQKLQKVKEKSISKYERQSGKAVSKYEDIAAKQRQQKVKIDELSTTIQNSLNTVNTLSSVQMILANVSDVQSKRDKLVQDNAEGKGNFVLAASQAFTDQLANVAGGRMEMMLDVASIFNELDYLITGNEGKYSYYKNRLEADEKNIGAQVKAAADQMKPKGIDETYYNNFTQTTLGGTLQALTQMAASSFGAPVTGLFGGFFMSSLHQNKQQIRDMKNDFIKEAMDEGMSRKEAKEKFDKDFSPAMQTGYAYLQASVEGALSYVSGKIMKGGGKYSKKITNYLFNKVVSGLGGKVTARDIQVATYKEMGNLLSQFMSKGTNITMTSFEEFVEESTQMFAARAIDVGFDKWVGQDIDFQIPALDSKKFKDDYAHMAKVSLLSGSAGGFVQAAANNDQLLTPVEESLSLKERRQLDKFYEDMADASRNADLLESQLLKIQQEADEGAISQDVADQRKQKLTENYNVYSNIDSELNGRTQIDIASKIKEKNKLEEQIKDKPKESNQRIVDRIKEIDEEIKELSGDSNNVRKKGSKDIIRQQLEIVEGAKVLQDNKTIEKEVDRIAKENNYTKEEKEALLEEYTIDPKNTALEIYSKDNIDAIAKKYNIPKESLIDKETGKFLNEGLYLKDQGVILISEEASSNTEEHEGFHNYLDIALSSEENADAVFALAEQAMTNMEKTNPRAADALKKQIDKYKKDPKYKAKDVAEEVLTYYTQMKAAGVFKQDKNLLQQFTDYIKSLLRNIGLEPASITTSNIDEIIDDYVANVGKGKLSRRQRQIARGEVIIDEETKKRGREIREKMEAETPVIDMTIEEELSTAASKTLSPELKQAINKEIKETGAQINDALSNPQTSEDVQIQIYENFLDERAPANTKKLIDNVIKQQLRKNGVDTKGDKANVYGVPIDDFVNQVKDEFVSRSLTRFNPDVAVKLPDGRFDVGGFVISEIARYRIGDALKKIRPKQGDVSIDQVSEATGKPMDVADTSAEEAILEQAETRKAKPTPKGKLPREFPETFDKKLKEDFETAAFEILESDLVDVDSTDFKGAVTDIFRGKLSESVKKKLGGGKNYEFVIKKLAPKMKEIFPAQWFVRIEGQTKPENRLFTNPPVRLTKQKDIDAAKRRDDVYVENTSQGVNLYTFKEFDPKVLSDYLLAPLEIVSKKTGKTVRSGLRGTRKTAVTEGVVDVMGRDVVPQTAKQIPKLKDKIAKISEKMQRDQEFLAAKEADDDFKSILNFTNENFTSKQIKELAEISRLRDKNQLADNLGLDKEPINEKTRERLQGKVQEAADNGYLTPLIIEAGKMASGGKQTFYGNIDGKKYNKVGEALKAGIEKPLKFAKLTTGEYVVIAKPETVKGKKEPVYVADNAIKEEVAKHNNYIAKPGRLYWGAKDPAYVKLKETASKNQIGKAPQPKRINVIKDGINKIWYGKNKAQAKINMQALKDVAIRLELAHQNGMPLDVANLILVQAYQATTGLIKTAPFFKYRSETFEYGPADSKEGQRTGEKFREEHNPPASVVGASLLWAIKNNKVESLFPFIENNFYQTQLSKADDHKLDIAKLDAMLPEGTSILDNPAIRLSAAGINLNTIINVETGKTMAEELGLGVPKNLKYDPNVVAYQNKLVAEQVLEGKSVAETKAKLNEYVKKNGNQPSLAQAQQQANDITAKEIAGVDVVANVKESKNMDMETLLSKAATVDDALRLANSLDQPVKKIRVFDFDDTLATSNNIVFATKDDKTIELNAEEFAKRGLQLKEDGWEMDFSDFNKVTDGGRGPLFEVAKTIKEARGNEDLFVLTARAPQSQEAIYEFLKAEGLEFKRENIVGLGNSTGEAKANWIVDKAAEGYNDFYFADDAYQNVAAVRDALSVIDVKSKVQQARVKESKTLNKQFNDIIETTTGIGSEKTFSKSKAEMLGSKKGRYKFWIPPSAEDFVGLMYPNIAKGKKGEAQQKWIKENLLDPWAKGNANLANDRLNLMNDFKQLKKSLNVPKELKKTNDTGFTNEQAVRVHLFTAMGQEVPGLSKKDTKELNDIVENNPKLKLFSEQILMMTKGDGYIKPGNNWLAGTITTDLMELMNTVKRDKYLDQWRQNVDAIFTDETLNKLEAIHGAKYREAVENMLARMKAGKNRLSGGNRLSNQMLDYINGSTAVIMFFNTRSAILQSISAANYINWSFNNPIKAGAAFANQPQYWKDFAMLMNSDYLKDRRNGQRINISENEITNAAKTSKNKAKGAISYILSKGYLPTQIMDSFAIASGGATYYRNRVNDLLKETDTEGNKVYTKQQAEEIALREWTELAEENQQSSRVDKISQQQASDVGRLLLAFANTPMQYARIQKRAIQDLVNGRGDAKENVSKILYYGFVQNMIFNAMQQAVFAIGFGDDEDDEKKEKTYFNTVNGMLDSILRGLGIGGQAVSVGKNFLLDIYERSGRKRPEYVDSIWQLTKISPPIGSKISKLRQAAWQFDSKTRRQKIFDEGFSLDNPALEALCKVVSATANVPLDRVLQKFKNVEAALEEDNEIWETVAMLAGWPEWQIKGKRKNENNKDKGITIVDDGGIVASPKSSKSKPIVIVD